MNTIVPLTVAPTETVSETAPCLRLSAIAPVYVAGEPADPPPAVVTLVGKPTSSVPLPHEVVRATAASTARRFSGERDVIGPPKANAYAVHARGSPPAPGCFGGEHL